MAEIKDNSLNSFHRIRVLAWIIMGIAFLCIIFIFMPFLNVDILKISVLTLGIICILITTWLIKNIVYPALRNDFSSSPVWKPVYTQLQKQNEVTQKAASLLENISQGNDINDSIFDFKENGTLGQAVSILHSRLKNIAEDEGKRAWSVNGIARFGQLLRENLNSDPKDLAYYFISELVKYINANQGGLYLINENEEGHQFLELTGCYAYERKKHQSQLMDLSEGLIGQCVYEKETILLTDVPKDYIKITSGLGEATPNCVVIVPIKINEDVLGAVELASFEILEDYKIKLIEKTAENFASIYVSIKSSRHMQKLLKDSQKITEELKIKENDLVQNEEELRAAQENLNHKLIELMAESNLTKSIISAINKSNASIQFDMNGNILDANDMFLSMMCYTKQELVGQNETLFIPKDELDSNRYSMLWDSLRQGVFNAGEFRRMSKEGKEIWMDVTYNPILDLNDKPFKILMLAVFTTEAKARENEYKNKINALNEAMAFIELNTDLSIKSANQYFLSKMNLKRKDLRETTFLQLLKNNYNDNDVLVNIEIALSQGQDQHHSLTFISSDNRPVLFMATLTAARDINGKLCNHYVLLSEVNKDVSIKSFQ